MTLSVEILGEAATLRSLERELRADPELRGTRLSRLDAPPAADEMGFVTEALQWITDNNALLGALVGGIAGYLARQRTPVRVKVRIGDREVEIESAGLKDPERVAREALDRLDGPRV